MNASGLTGLRDLAARAWEQHRLADTAGLPHLVRPAIPILFFGDSVGYVESSLKVITAGLNPSREEFPREDPLRRFPGFSNPGSGGEPDLRGYLAALNGYFTPSADPYKAWFNPSFEEILRGMDASYYDVAESTALHTDLCSPLATNPTWTGLTYAEQTALQHDGLTLWHDLVEQLQPDVVLLSIRRELLREIAFRPVEELRVVFTVLETRTGSMRKAPYRIEAVRRRLASGKEPLFVFGRASQTPFGSISGEDKRKIGARVRELIR